MADKAPSSGGMQRTLGLTGVTMNAMALIAPGAFLWITMQLQAANTGGTTDMWTGIVVALFAALLPVREAGDLCNIGTLLAFIIVCVGIMVLRVREPHLPRKFRTPLIWFVAPMGVISAFGLSTYPFGPSRG